MTTVNLIFAIVSWLAIIFTIALIVKSQFTEQKELTRKIIHIGTGPLIPLAWWLEISKSLAAIIASIITIALLVNHRIRFISAIEDVPRKSYGTIAYGLSITLLILWLWPEHADAVSAGVLVMAFGDGFAGLIGKEVKSKNWAILGQKKSLAGTLTMALMSGITLISISYIIGLPFYPIKLFTIMLIAVVLEQISCWGIDNLTVPLGVAMGWIWIINSSNFIRIN